jgi:hypothetical protein
VMQLSIDFAKFPAFNNTWFLAKLTVCRELNSRLKIHKQVIRKLIRGIFNLETLIESGIYVGVCLSVIAKNSARDSLES